LTKVDIQERISELQKPICDKLQLDAAYVIMRLQRNEQETYEAKDFLQNTRCLELLGKVAGIFTEKVSVEQRVPLGPRTIVLNMPDGSVIEKSQEAAEEARKKLGRPPKAAVGQGYYRLYHPTQGKRGIGAENSGDRAETR